MRRLKTPKGQIKNLISMSKEKLILWLVCPVLASKTKNAKKVIKFLGKDGEKEIYKNLKTKRIYEVYFKNNKFYVKHATYARFLYMDIAGAKELFTR